MIPFENIKTILKGISDEIGIAFIRADQQGDHTTYPFFSYKILSSAEESTYQNIREVVENIEDDTNADVKTYHKSEATISITFLDKNRIDRIYNAAGAAFDYLKSIDCKQLAKENEITLQLISPVVEDRTIYQESFFENKIGFDIRMDYTGLYTQTIEGIEEITIEREIDGVDKPDIIFPD